LAGATTTTATTIAAGGRPTSTVGTGDPITTTTSIAPSGEVVVAHLQGDADTPSSASFHVDGHWQLRWRVEQGKGVAATVDNDDDPNQSPFFVPMTPGEGSHGFVDGCNCTLHLTPDGSTYDVLVVDVEG
jgi:hypothetical protein